MNDGTKLILLNISDATLIKSIKSLEQNYKTPSFKISKSNLSKENLIDAFELINIKNIPKKEIERSIKKIIIENNFALNHACKSKQKQLGYISKNLINHNFSSQTLSRINKEIDIEICKKLINKNEIKELEKYSLNEIKNKLKSSNEKIFLSEIISTILDLKINSTYDIDFICSYITKNNLKKISQISIIKDFIKEISSSLKTRIESEILFKVILEIESKKQREIGSYNFFTDTWLEKDTDKKQVINYIIKKIENFK